MKKRAAIVLIFACVWLLFGCATYGADLKQPSSTDISANNNSNIQNDLAEGIIQTLQNKIKFGEKDVLTFSEGNLESIDIQSSESAEILFQCIRNYKDIVDMTGAVLEPMALPIQINGQGIGTFECIYIEYPKTEQFLCIVFTPEDSAALYDHVMELECPKQKISQRT